MSKPSKFDGLLNKLCAGWGFCGCITAAGEPRHVTQLIPRTGTISAAQFAEWVLQAEWPRELDDPGYEIMQEKWSKRIAGLFVNHMGAETVDAADLRTKLD